MSERVKEIVYKGKTIVYCDLSNTKGDEIKTTTDRVDQIVIDKGTSDQLFLVNINDCVIDPKALQVFKESAKRLQPYLKGSASFGLSGLKALFMNAINRFSGMGMTAHPSMEDAKEYLVLQVNK
ncbi:MAG: hypothetical protein GY832_33110 [Chloroflexi bacterium]|nr:hypothetical protein [Chloroflexota bacterium]